MRALSSEKALGRGQLAFVRCWAEGLDLASAWERYASAGATADLRRVRTELRQLIDRLSALARAHGRPDVAVLLRRDPQAIVDRGPRPPTLEEFRATLPADFYGEAELQDLYRDTYGAPDARGPERRRQRLRERLVLALQWLERVAAREPLPTDRIEAWLDERIVARLSAAGLSTLADLVQRIRDQAQAWHRRVPRLGAQGARRLERWLAEHEATLGPLASPAPEPASGSAIVPLERFALPRPTSTGLAAARPSASTLGDVDDLRAVQAWLALRPAPSHTWRAYRKEAERFLLWLVLVRGKALAEVDPGDALAYRAFLAAPPAGWCAPRHTSRTHPGWRPFEGPLSPRSAETALAVVRSMLEWLARRRHLPVHPWEAMPPPDRPPAPPTSAPSIDEWAAVDAWLRSQPPSPAATRRRLLIGFAYRSGLRLSELANARLGWLQRLPGAGWSMRIPSDPPRAVVLGGSAVALLSEALEPRQLEPERWDARAVADEPLFARFDGAGPLSAARLHQVLVAAFRACADDVERRDPVVAARIRRATARWLRHAHGAQARSHGLGEELIEQQLRRGGPVTTEHLLERHRQWSAAFG